MNPNALHYLFIALAVLIGSALAMFALRGGGPFESDDAAPVYLFVQTAERGSFAPMADGEAGDYILTLEDVSPSAVYFTDRPYHLTGTIGVEELIGGALFDAEEPPNAAVVLSAPQSPDEDVIIVELLEPRLDTGERRLSYLVRLLDGQPTGGLLSWTARSDRTLASSFSHVTLFIDTCGRHVPCF